MSEQFVSYEVTQEKAKNDPEFVETTATGETILDALETLGQRINTSEVQHGAETATQYLKSGGAWSRFSADGFVYHVIGIYGDVAEEVEEPKKPFTILFEGVNA